jgi:hypothetical protein
LNTHFGYCDVQNVTGLGERRARGIERDRNRLK